MNEEKIAILFKSIENHLKKNKCTYLEAISILDLVRIKLIKDSYDGFDRSKQFQKKINEKAEEITQSVLSDLGF